MADLTAAVVGLGLGATHVEGYCDDPRISRVLVCDTDEGRLEDAQRQFDKVDTAYRSLDELLTREKPDVISVVTPDRLHVPHALACLEAGCHTLITKPLATTLEDARQILEASTKAKPLCMVAHERRFRQFTRQLRGLLDSGRMGLPIHLRIDQIQDKRSFIAERPWLFTGKGSRTALTGSGVHEVDRVRHLIGGELEEVFAYGNRLGQVDIPANTTMALLMRFAGGAVGQVTITYDAHWPPGGFVDDGFRLVAQHGLVVGNRFVHDGLQWWQTLPEDHHGNAVREGSLGCLQSFLDSVVEGRPVAVPVEEGFASVAACLAAEESAATGRPVHPQR